MSLIDQLCEDAITFIERLMIIDKQGKLVRLKLNSEQRAVVLSLLEGNNLVVVKARQLGITTVVTAFFFWLSYISKDTISCVSLSHKRDSSDEIFRKYSNYYDCLPRLLQKMLAKRTSSSLRLQGTGSSITAFTAGGKGGLRSFTVTRAHISELCFYDDPDELLSTVLAALNGNQIIIESTAKQYGDAMHSLVDKTQRGELPGSWKLLFFPWQEHEEYQTEPPEDFLATEYEQELATLYGLSDAQLYWRRSKIQEMGLSKFKTEYPACLEDVFSQKGDAYYTESDMENLETIPLPAQETNYIHQPDKNDRYAVGVDVASGVGKDYSVIVVLSKRYSKPVYIFRSKDISTSSLAMKIQAISVEYNNAKVLVESNNWGLPVLNELKHLGFTNLWKDNGADWTTTTKSKLLMHEELKEAIRTSKLNQLDYITVTELRSLALNDSGLAPESVRTATGHSDNVIALGLAWQCLKTVPAPQSAVDNMLQASRINKLRRTNPYGATSLNRNY